MDVGTWRSLVARLLWEQDVAGSNPVVPTSRGCGSMVELKPSKLLTRVRFPSPAPLKPQARALSLWLFCLCAKVCANCGPSCGPNRGQMSACIQVNTWGRPGQQFLHSSSLPAISSLDCERKSRRRQMAFPACTSTGAPSRTRTCNRRIRSPMLYPLSHGRTKRRYYTANPQKHVGSQGVMTKTIRFSTEKVGREKVNSRRIKVIDGSRQGSVEFLQSMSCDLRQEIGHRRMPIVRSSSNYL